MREKENWFSSILLKWNQSSNHRKMPWKGEKNPYFIWLSEIILQQTRVEQGWDYFLKFKNQFPTIKDLAKAPEDQVLSLWQGLGYYSRARNLHHTAKYIHQELDGAFPDTFTDLLKLKGVGTYTASAIASFAYNLPHAVVDGNVVRILSRVFKLNHSFDTPQGKKYFNDLANILIDSKVPALYNQAIMDFGATVCAPVQPKCTTCPFKSKCHAYLSNEVDSYPIKGKKIIKKDRFFFFDVSIRANKILIEKREEKDIWKGLYQLPLCEVEKMEFAKSKQPEYKQTLTHQKIHAKFLEKNPPKKLSDTQIWVDFKDLKRYGFPKIITTFIESNNFKNS